MHTENNFTGSYSGVKVTLAGLGLHGGGLEAAKFLARYGAELTVTDLRGEDVLKPSIENLDDYVKNLDSQAKPVRYVLGKHETEDFKNADLVIKNPGMPPSSPYLQVAKKIETDISLFLRYNPARLFAVTGSKGKSFTSSALHYGLAAFHKKQLCGSAYLGGNITVSPLTFLEKLNNCDDVVLELSSWQLGDIKTGLLKPKAAVLTPIMKDHQDRYGSMDSYVADKRRIYAAQDKDCATIALNDSWGKSFLAESKGRSYFYSATPLDTGIAGAYLENGAGFAQCINGFNDKIQIVPKDTLVPGVHQKINLLAASLAMLEAGLDPDFIKDCNAKFSGIEHRLEFFYEHNGIKFYNDTAATIPQAAACAVAALGNPILVTGGTDKNLDFSPLISACANAKKIILLDGSAAVKIMQGLKSAGIDFCGPCGSLAAALEEVYKTAKDGDIVVLSPGCTSFGMFLNEFDRGRKWKETVVNSNA
ncbi:MAG: UDP-N-acetylmuramoyl-L-alanine--D-glutamate ligase [Termitinemataceae bacterium]|nr:MAG: UDP-N-acetylmuramoyl-L-alanine--D-glutamate ligase [Termitinemataceae bacterium]